jgi:hypothetical protein
MRQKRLETTRTPEQRERISKALKIACAKPEVRQRKIAALARPDVREKIGSANKKKWADPEIKEKRCKAIKEAMSRPEVKERLSKAAIERNKKFGNPNWRGGESFKPYCRKFNEYIKNKIREAFKYKCYLCPNVQGKKKLSIHHIDYHKNTLCDGRIWPLIPLCCGCHSKTNFNRWYWFNLLMNYWAMNPEIHFIDKDLIYQAMEPAMNRVLARRGKGY